MSSASAPAPLPPAYEVRGPAALSGDRRRIGHLTVTMAFTDWKLRFFGSVLGYVWTLLRPLLLFGVLYLVFGVVFPLAKGIEAYPILLLVGVLLFGYFAEVTGGGVTSVVDREPLVRKVAFPRIVVPLSVALAASFNLALNLVAIAVFVAIADVEPRLSWLLVPFPVILLILLSGGTAMLLSALFVPFRDVRPIWEVIAQALFYATPVIYPIEALRELYPDAAQIAMMNPLAAIIQEVRHLLVGGATPSAAEAIGGAPLLLVPAGVLVVLTVAGYVVFNRTAPYVAERL